MKPLIVANWKMQLDDETSIATAARLAETLPGGVDVALCPPFTALAPIADVLRGSAVLLGAQDCAWEARGALTGEVSPSDLNALGCRYVILGHSERRQYLGETDDMVAKKLRAALAAALIPIVCIGETTAERTTGQLEVVLTRQLGAVLDGLELLEMQQCIVAYEPLWAIGTGEPATLDNVRSAHALVAALLQRFLGQSHAIATPVLYGGSVDALNVASLVALPHVDGVLVGTASQTAARLRNVVAAVAEVHP